MSRNAGVKWAKKAYLLLSLAVVVILWGCFFGSLLWGRLSHGPVEETWFAEVMKWVVMTPVLVVIVDVIAYALIMSLASGRGDDEEKKLKK